MLGEQEIEQHASGEQVGALVNARAARVSAYQQGKNQILFFEPELTEKIQKRLLQENDILHAMEQNDFTLFIQPQVNMRTGAVVALSITLVLSMSWVTKVFWPVIEPKLPVLFEKDPAAIASK